LASRSLGNGFWSGEIAWPRIGRIVIARGRDAADVAISTQFGHASLAKFKVITDEIAEVTAYSSAASATAKLSDGVVHRPARIMRPYAPYPHLAQQIVHFPGSDRG
jgi:hypothetical protein